MPRFPEIIQRYRSASVMLGALVCGLGFHLAGFLLFKVDAGDLAYKGPPKPFLYLVETEGSRDPVLAEQALLEDPAPLFLPTRWNASLSGVSAFGPLEEPDLFSSFPEEVTASAETFRATLEQRPPRPVAPLQTIGEPPPFRLFGAGDIDVKPLARRFGQVEIREVASGRVVHTTALVPIPAIAALQYWEPAELLVTVSPLGAVGTPFLARSTGNDAADEAIRQTLIRSGLHTLPPGYYAVTVGP